MIDQMFYFESLPLMEGKPIEFLAASLSLSGVKEIRLPLPVRFQSIYG